MRSAARKGGMAATEAWRRDVGKRFSDEETPFDSLRHPTVLRQASGLVDRRDLASSPHLRAQCPVHSTMGSRHSCPPTGVPGFVGGLETGPTVTYSLRHETCIKLQG